MPTFSLLTPAVVLLGLSLIAADPEVRPPATTMPREIKTDAADDSLPKFDDHATAEEAPEAVKRVPPEYPPLAIKAGITGTVVVAALVGRDGLVKATRVVSSIPMLDDAAVTALRQWVFKPARTDGKPVAVWITVPTKFSRSEGRTTDPTRAAFDTAWVELRRPGPKNPSEADALLRERIIRLALSLNPPIEVSDLAKQHFKKARAVTDSSSTPPAAERALIEVAAALHEAPWWSDAYYEAGTLLERAGHPVDAAVALDLYLVADPKSTRWEQVRKKLVELHKKAAR